ncbi:MAG: quinolinate synthase [Thermoplasmata archaeon M11B2D]|nr:MAG: quinolinate synthase [Thermoplasmata archaeon M11B2D]
MDRQRVIARIEELKRKHHAVLLVHNYQIPEVQDIADFLGDSLDLSLKATKTDARVIIFCGVDFMAESAQILNPDKTVIMPDPEAKCPMAAMVDAETLQALKQKHPDAEVVTYINTPAEVKAISTICCTSSNGIKVVKSRLSEKVIFVPDTNLGLYIQRFVPEKNMILWPGICSTHHNIRKEDILDLKNKHPYAEVVVHPECRPEVIDIADHVHSTNGMVQYTKQAEADEFIIGTEKDMCYRLKKENPTKMFYPVREAICPSMKRVTVQKILKSLETLEPRIKLPQEIMDNARRPLQRMMDMGRGD